MREEGQADRYGELRINYVNHHNPDLILFDKSENELHRIDLTRLRTLESMHKLIVLLGLKEVCRNVNPNCVDWAATGECENNFDFMSHSCRKSCKFCAENSTFEEESACRDYSPAHDCQYWFTMGQCDENPDFMHVSCAKSCGICTDVNTDSEDEFDDMDKDEL